MRDRAAMPAQTAVAHPAKFVVCESTILDGFWIHRVLQSEGIESHVVDPASIATSRRRRRAKTDKIDGEAQVRALLAYKRGEPRVCAMVKAPTPQEEDRRRISREREVLTAERVQHVNRIKGLLFAQGIGDYEALHRNRREQLEELITGDGRPLPECLKAQIRRELDRLELLIEQVKAVEAERDAVLAQAQANPGVPAPAALLLALRGMCGRPVWTPPPVQEESLNRCGAGSGAAMCPASAAAAHSPRARMGVRGSGPHHWSTLEALSSHLVLLIPSHRRLRHTCPSTSSRRRQPHTRRPLTRRRPELDNFRPWRSTPTRSAPSCWPAPPSPASAACGRACAPARSPRARPCAAPSAPRHWPQ